MYQLLQLENIFEHVGLSDSRTVYIYSLYLEGFSSFIKSLRDIWKKKRLFENFQSYLGDFTRYICGKAYNWEEGSCFKTCFWYIFDSNALMALLLKRKADKSTPGGLASSRAMFWLVVKNNMSHS